MGGDGNDRPSTRFRYREFFEDACPYYMAMGMSYDEFWNGDHILAKYYRQADKIRQERKNADNWYMGYYIYETMCCVAPLYNAFAKDHKPVPYREEPLPLTEEEAKAQEVRREQRRQAEMERKIMQFVKQHNEHFAQNNNEKGET